MHGKFLNNKIKGFMGRTHTLLSIILMIICMIIPLEPFQKTFWVLKDNKLFFIVALITLVGGALLPDLDNCESFALHSCGPLGSIFMTFMQSTSSIMWNIYHMRGDARPQNQHRYLWHTPIIGIGIVCMFYFGLPSGNYTIITNLKTVISSRQLPYFIQTNAILCLFIILAFMAALTGSSMVIGKLSKVLPIPWVIKYIFPVGILVYIGTANYTQLKILGVCLGAGYLFHIIEDIFADSGVPAIWPIPALWCKKVWWKIRFPFSIKTGGIINTIIDIIVGIIAIVLVILILAHKI